MCHTGTDTTTALNYALYRGSGSGRLSSVDETDREADGGFTPAADAAREAESAFELTGRGGSRARSGDSVSSVADPRKGGISPAAGKTLVWGDSAHDSPTSTTAGPSTAASHRGDYRCCSCFPHCEHLFQWRQGLQQIALHSEIAMKQSGNLLL